jgi:nucleotide-binding universal stress UspA family protein
MFKRLLLCHDGTEIGRRALKQGAELSVSLGAEVHVLIVVRDPDPALSAAVAAGFYGQACIVNQDASYQQMLAQSIERLKVRGVNAYGHLAYGNAVEKIAALSKSLAADLVVVGQYPNSGGRRWWSGPERATLAESVDCAVLIAVNTHDN